MPEHVAEDILSVDQMLAAEDVQFTTIPVPEWHGSVRVGSLTAGELLAFVEANEGATKKAAGIRMLVQSLVDKNGTRIGTEKDVAAFQKKNAAVINRIAKAILKLNGLEKEAAAALGNASSEAA